MIPVYNSTNYLKVAILTVLAQDPGEEEMQIEVIDDYSEDGNVQGVVEELGKGRVKYFRQAMNVGSLKNFETCLLRARGQYVHLLHGDDLVHPGFYSKVEALFQQFPSAGVACTRYNLIDSKGLKIAVSDLERSRDGILADWLNRLALKQRLQYSSVVVKRQVYEAVGGFYGVHYGEDWEMWVRIASKYSFVYTPQVLASYRGHNSSISSKSHKSGQNFKDIKWVIDQIQNSLPEDQRKRWRRVALRQYASFTILGAFITALRDHEFRNGLRQFVGALKFYFDLHVLMMVTYQLSIFGLRKCKALFSRINLYSLFLPSRKSI